MGDDDADRPEPPSAKAVNAMLREARSLSRRADKLNDTAAAVEDPITQQLTAQACTSMEQLVHHLMLWNAKRSAASSQQVGAGSCGAVSSLHRRVAQHGW